MRDEHVAIATCDGAARAIVRKAANVRRVHRRAHGSGHVGARELWPQVVDGDHEDVGGGGRRAQDHH